MSLDREDDPDARTYEYADRTLLWRMVQYLLAYRKLFVSVVVFTVFGIIISVWTPFVMMHAIDVDFPSGNLQAILFTALFYIILQFFAWASAYGQEYLMALMGQRAVYDIRQDLYEHVQEMSEEFHDHASSGVRYVLQPVKRTTTRPREGPFPLLWCGGCGAWPSG